MRKVPPEIWVICDPTEAELFFHTRDMYMTKINNHPDRGTQKIIRKR